MLFKIGGLQALEITCGLVAVGLILTQLTITCSRVSFTVLQAMESWAGD